MPKVLSIVDLKAAKEKHDFSWLFGDTLPPKKVVGKSCRAYFYLKCGLCLKESWVEWGSLKRGRTKCCANCSLKKSIPTLDEMYSIIKKYNMLWKPSIIFKVDKKTSRRKFWMNCKCGKTEWVRWNHFQQGLTHGCKSCSARVARNGLNKYDYSKSEIRKAWYVVCREVREKSIINDWSSYEQFKQWSFSNGFRDGAKFRRADSKKSFTKENSLWDTKNLSPGRNTIRTKGYTVIDL